MRKRIFIGPIEIAGYFGNLAKALKSQKEDVTFATYSDHPFGYNLEDQIFLFDCMKKLDVFRSRISRNGIFIKIIFFALKGFLAYVHLFWALFKYDVFIFGFGRSLLKWNIDLPVLRIFGKIIIFNLACGSDSRPPYCDGSYQSEDGMRQPDALYLQKLTRRMFIRLRTIQKYSNVVIAAPFTSQFITSKCVNSTALGFPYIVNSDAFFTKESSSLIRILHSPSHPAAKGTMKIRLVIDALIAKGYRFKYVELQGRPNSEVLKEISQCSFVIDQIYSDFPMAGLATEAAWFGKPAVVGGYGLSNLKNFVPEGMFPPSQICHPDNLVAAVEQLIVDADYRNDLGEKARCFVNSQWSAEKIAERYIRLIEGNIPESFWLNPSDVTYLYGCGLPEEKVKEYVRNIVKGYGVSSLQLTHRPDLEQAFLAFAGIES